MGDLSNNFSRWEFSCRCGCGFDRIKPELVKQVQRFRDLLRFAAEEEVPLRVTSGCRCPAHNAAIGGAKNSFHTQGMAVDFIFDYDHVISAGRMISRANEIGLMKVAGIGVYPDRDFVHLDIRPGNLTTWINENGFYRYGVDFYELHHTKHGNTFRG